MPLSKLCFRSDWGQNLDLQIGWKRRHETPKTIEPRGIVLHHTDPTEAFNAVDHQTCVARVRYWFNQHVQTWSDIGYHFIICPHGFVFEGRGERDNRPIQGAHALNNNDRSLGIALMGNYCHLDPADTAVTSLKETLAALCRRFNISPEATMEWCCTKEDGTIMSRQLPAIVAHCDLKYTECPGHRLHHCLEYWRRELQAKLASASENQR